MRSYRWSADAVRRLDEEMHWALNLNPAGPAEVAGVLLGRNGPSIEIIDCYPVFLMRERDHAYALAGPGMREFERTIASFQSSQKDGLGVVGLYRGLMGESLDLTEDDRSLIRTCFQGPRQIVLLMKIGKDSSRHIRLFSGDNGQPLSEFHSAEDGLQISKWLELWHHLSSGDDTEVLPREHKAESIDPAMPDVEAVREDSIQLKRSPNRALPLVLAGAFIVAFFIGILIFQRSATLNNSANTPRPAALTVQPSAGHHSELALRAYKDGDDLRPDWNHTAPVLAAASGGILTIRERNKLEKNVTLDGDLLRTGAIVYRPAHNEVFLRLVILGQGGAKLKESVDTYPKQVSDTRQ